MTVELILRSQAGDKAATLELVDKFNPLLKKYAFRLFYDDAYDDLLVDFIELLHSIRLACVRNKSEGGLVSYISKSIQSSYIKQSIASQKLRHYIPNSDFEDDELYYLEATTAVSDTYFAYEFPNIERVLTKQEASMIRMIYIMGYSACETAHRLGISRQAVNQMKNRALRKLKTKLTDKL